MEGRPAAGPGRPSGFTVTSTSRNSATVSPIVLRESESVRLLFKPQLVNNARHPDASVDGVFCYQRKRKSEAWESVDAISLSSLRAGEGVKLDLKASEMLRLFQGLQVLYDTVERDGVPTGVHQYLQADPGSVLSDVSQLLRDGRAAELLQTFLSWASESTANLADHFKALDDSALLNFDAAIGVARLSRFVDEAASNLTNADESYWQEMLRREPWVISQLYASPMVIVREQAYVGGKSIDNRGGTIVDYMFRNSLSENSLIVELKTPATPLLGGDTYRNRIHGPSKELSSATQQLLHARQTLQEQYLTLTAAGGRTGFNIFGTRALLVVGSMPTDPAAVRSFEIYRNAQRGVEIVTFDELLSKGRLILDAMSRTALAY